MDSSVDKYVGSSSNNLKAEEEKKKRNPLLSSCNNTGLKAKSKGEQGWTKELLFCLEDHELLGKSPEPTKYGHDDLLGFVDRLKRNDAEQIVKVTAFKCPLSAKQIAEQIPFFNSDVSALLFHVFVIVETETWLYLVSKGSSCLEICRQRRSDERGLEKLLLKMEQFPASKNHSPKAVFMKDALARGTLADIVAWIHRERQLNETYNCLDSNCQDFACEVFNMVAKGGERLVKLDLIHISGCGSGDRSDEETDDMV